MRSPSSQRGNAPLPYGEANLLYVKPKPLPNFPKDMDERINGDKLGEDFLKEFDKYMKQKQVSEHRAKRKS